MKNSLLTKLAFTLAEVLITLAIIGIIAAFTIPSVITNFRRHALKTGFWKAYKEMSEVTSSLFVEYGKITPDYLGDSFDFKNALKKRIKCTADKSKLANTVTLLKATYKNYKNTESPYVEFIRPFCDTTSGMTIFVLKWNYYNAYDKTKTGYYFGIDTNSFQKGPNKWGYDLFHFNIPITTGDRLAPSRYGYCTQESDPEARYNGCACAYWATKDQNPDNKNKKYWDSLKF